MSLWHIAWNYLWSRKLTTILTIMSVALGVGLIAAVHTLRSETQKRFEEEGQAFDIVVGDKGSPLQLVLSSVYFMDAPSGNILYSEYEKVRDHEDVAAAFPIGLGDTYRGFRIVGTSRALMDHAWHTKLDDRGMPVEGEERRPFQIAEGRFFEKNFEAVVGAIVAEQTGLMVGDTFTGTHGFVGDEHADCPYTVVGIMKRGGTPNDRAIFCTLESVWEVHGHSHDHADGAGHGEEVADAHGGEAVAASVDEHGHGSQAGHDEQAAGHSHDTHDSHDGHADEPATEHTDTYAAEHAGHDAHGEPLEVTAVLVTLDSPALRFSFMEYVKTSLNANAAVPVMEIQKLYAQLLSTANAVLLSVAYLVVVSSALTIMIGLYLAILQRRRDLAIMRALGASAMDIFGAVILEAFLVTLLGIAAGWFLGNVVSWGVGQYLTERLGMNITAFGLSGEEVKSFAMVALVGYLAGLLPAWQAYQVDVARDLTRP